MTLPFAASFAVLCATQGATVGVPAADRFHAIRRLRSRWWAALGAAWLLRGTLAGEAASPRPAAGLPQFQRAAFGGLFLAVDTLPATVPVAATLLYIRAPATWWTGHRTPSAPRA